MQTAVLVIAAVAMLAGVGTMVYFRLFPQKNATAGGGDSVSELREKNLSFEPPTSPWTRDDDLRAKLAPPIFIVYKRTDPDAFMAFGARDFDNREPRPSELREGLTRPLNNLFEDIEKEEASGVKWLEQPAIMFAFRGRMKQGGVVVAGECHAVSYKGIGYWSICWAGESDTKDQLTTFDATRTRFKLLKEREKWAAKESSVRVWGGHRLPYQLLDTEGIWSELDQKDHKPEDVDPKADLLLHARMKRRGADRPSEADLVVLVLESAGGDPLVEGQKYVEDLRTAEVKAGSANLAPKFVKREGDPEGDPATGSIEATAPVVRLQATVPGAGNQARLIVVSAINMGKQVVVVYAWCAWNERAIFESKLMQVASSLREGK